MATPSSVAASTTTERFPRFATALLLPIAT